MIASVRACDFILHTKLTVIPCRLYNQIRKGCK
jgi:hypothetical protein